MVRNVNASIFISIIPVGFEVTLDSSRIVLEMNIANLLNVCSLCILLLRSTFV